MSENTGVKSEIDFFSMLFFFLGRWKQVVLGTTFCTVLGLAYALLSKPVYQADAIVTSRDSQGGGGSGSSFLSQLGGLGGAMATQFGLMNTNLDKMEIILKSREMARRVIEKHDLMPRLYAKNWDAKNKKWKVKSAPSLKVAAEGLRKGILKVVVEPRKKILQISANTDDSTLSADIVTYYLEALNTKLQEDTRTDAEGNRQYLEKQLISTQDPLLRERIQNLMAVEIEKSMLMSTKAFDVLENPSIPLYRLKPKRGQIVIISFLLGIIISCMGIMVMEALAARKKS